MQFPRHLLLICAFLMALPMATGCQSFDLGKNRGELFSRLKPKKRDVNGPKSPHRMLVIWKDAVVRSGNGQAKKGFGGRVYFLSLIHI